MSAPAPAGASEATERQGRWARGVAVSGALLAAGTGFGLWAQYAHSYLGFIAVALAQGAVYAVAAALLLRGAAGSRLVPLILVVAALMRLVALAAPVFLSDDLNRYIWDGRVQAHGINPYRYIPTDPHLASLQDPVVFPHINRNNYAPTIYPPVAEMLFFLATRFGETALAIKLAMVGLEAVGIAALCFVLRGARAPPERILLYAWHPLPVWEIAGSGHVDAAIVAFVMLALLAAQHGGRTAAGAALGAAALVKFFPAVVAPAVWRPNRANHGDWRLLAGFAAVAVACYVPYLGVGARVFGFLPGYVEEERLASGGGFWLIDLVRPLLPVPGPVYAAVAIAAVAALAVAALLRARGEAPSLGWAAALAVAFTFLASPHYPWYFVWLLPLLCAAPWWPALWPSLVAPLLYWHAKTGFVPLWVGFTLYGGFAILALGERLASRIWRQA